MKTAISVVAVAAALLTHATSASAAGPQAEVMHWWVSAGESAAVKEVAKAYEAMGGVWKDSATAGGEVAIPNIVSRITGGNPPTAAQMPLGKQIDDLASQGLLAPVDKVAMETGFYDNIPEAFQKAMKFTDGHMYAVPINDHGHNWVYYNKKVLADAGAKEPENWDDFFAAVDKIKAKGNAIPIAVGAQPWQLGQTFFSVLLSKEGVDLYMKIYRDLDTAAIDTPEFKDAVKTFLRLRDYSDAGAANREWNVAANMVISGKAGFQFMGDWEKGEFLAAGQKPDVDFGCQILASSNGRRYFTMSADAIIFPVNKNADQQKAQDMLEHAIMSKEVQIAFNAKKGSEPARLDVDASKLDACAVKGVTILQDADQRVPATDFLISPDSIGAERDLAGQAWADPKYTPEQFVAAMTKIIEAEKAMR